MTKKYHILDFTSLKRVRDYFSKQDLVGKKFGTKNFEMENTTVQNWSIKKKEELKDLLLKE